MLFFFGIRRVKSRLSFPRGYGGDRPDDCDARGGGARARGVSGRAAAARAIDARARRRRGLVRQVRLRRTVAQLAVTRAA